MLAQPVRDSTLLSNLKPLTKLVCLLLLTLTTFFARSVEEVAILFSITLLLFFANRIRVGSMKWLFVPVVAAIPGTMAVFMLSYWLEERNVQSAAARGSVDAALYVGRLMILLVANIIFVRTTDFRRLTEELRLLGLPATFVVLLATVFRFFPVLLEEVRRIFEVQRLRGLETKQLVLPKYWLPMALPFLIVTIQRAYELALSFYLRGGLVALDRKRLSVCPSDIAAVGATAAVMAIQMAYHRW